ncbi:MAG: M23 family metallopeptidase, partial [Candidatus Competibacterales bacterium]|nr:M23 family metallopeptidase [Candidatus Competibacterales bacterium]
RVSSPYQTERLHPVLGLRRPHTGIDLAAPTGTLIRAAGDGVIRFSGWQGGYGRTLILDHAREYSTLYAHLSRFKPGLREGSRVRRGEIIGYVGRSGLATGPHLHYEVRVNGVPHNPATVALPGSPPLDGERRAAFLRHAEPVLARIDLLRRTQLALQLAD